MDGNVELEADEEQTVIDMNRGTELAVASISSQYSARSIRCNEPIREIYTAEYFRTRRRLQIAFRKVFRDKKWTRRKIKRKG